MRFIGQKKTVMRNVGIAGAALLIIVTLAPGLLRLDEVGTNHSGVM